MNESQDWKDSYQWMVVWTAGSRKQPGGFLVIWSGGVLGDSLRSEEAGGGFGDNGGLARHTGDMLEASMVI